MSLILIAVTSILGIVIGKTMFRKWINHLTIYCFIMGGLIFLYELKLLPYPDIVPLAWFYIACSFLSFLFGILTIRAARNFSPQEGDSLKTVLDLQMFADGGRALKYSIIVFSIIGLISAIQRWLVLINIFGSIPEVLVHAYTVYSFKVHQEQIIEEFIPILPQFIYVAIFFSGVYAAYKGKFSFLNFFPIIVIIIKQFTDFGRAELLFTLVEFFFAFFLFRNLLKRDLFQRFKFSKSNAVFVSILLLALVVSAASFIRITRGTYENYQGMSRELKQLNENLVISPSVYLYLSSTIGVFSKYIESGGDEGTKIGENTFKGFYYFLSKFGIVEKPNSFQKGYYIPMWTNTGTYIRELHADFGIAGVFLGPYLTRFNNYMALD